LAPVDHLIIKNITAGYGGAPVLEDVSLTVVSGDSVAVWGRNGAGKTTLLRVISGLLTAQSGRVVLNGEDITDLPPHMIVRRGISHVPEGRRVIPGMTVLDNLKLGGFVHAAAQLDRRLGYIYELFPHIASWSGRRAGSLSGGEQQLLAIARAMMASPKLLLLDEPLTGLAPVIQINVLQALRRIRQENVGVLLVEQNVHQSLRVINRGILLEQGRIALQGTKAELQGDRRIQEGYLGTGAWQGLNLAVSPLASIK
jgi:branched-chain amino acid transport system ATP-binding protein